MAGFGVGRGGDHMRGFLCEVALMISGETVEEPLLEPLSDGYSQLGNSDLSWTPQWDLEMGLACSKSALLPCSIGKACLFTRVSCLWGTSVLLFSHQAVCEAGPQHYPMVEGPTPTWLRPWLEHDTSSQLDWLRTCMYHCDYGWRGKCRIEQLMTVLNLVIGGAEAPGSPAEGQDELSPRC